MSCPTAILTSRHGESPTMTGVTAHGSVRGLLFELTVEQKYRNASSTTVEVVYTFPVPYEAVLLDLEVELGDRKLTTVAVEKRQAERDYETALDEGNAAIMLERAADGLYTLNLGNLMAGENATIRYRYGQLLRFEQDSVRLAIPTVIAPRFGDPGRGGLAPHQVPETDLVVEYPFALTLDLHGELSRGEISSPSHPIRTQVIEDGLQIAIAQTAYLDRDFVLKIGGLSGGSLLVAGPDGDACVVLASWCTPALSAEQTAAIRLKLLVDCSGSMAGDSIEAARRALQRILSDLQPTDWISFSRFGTNVLHETPEFAAVSESQRKLLQHSISAMQADLGGTQTAHALEETILLGGSDGQADLLLVTDGEIWAVDDVITEATAARQRVFVIGIGAAPAESFLRRLAESTGGACEFIAPNEDVEGAIWRTFARLRSPRVQRAHVHWPTPPRWETPLPVGIFPGETIHSFAGFSEMPRGSAELTLQSLDRPGDHTARLPLPATVTEGTTLARIAAMHRLRSANPTERLQLALRYGLLTHQTNFLVVHERAADQQAQALPQLARVPQMHAAGWHGMGTVQSLNACFRSEGVMDQQMASAFRSIRKTRKFSRANQRSNHLCSPPPLAPPHETRSPQAALADFLMFLESTAAQDLPSRFNRLLTAGLPSEVQQSIFHLFPRVNQNTLETYDEGDFVKAVLEALGILVEDGTISVRVSRQFLRTLRNLFSSPEELRELRNQVQTAVRTALANG